LPVFLSERVSAGFRSFAVDFAWGLIVFLLLGFTAGVINVMRTAGVMAKQSERL